MLNDSNTDRRARFLELVRTIPLVGTIGRWGVSTWDCGDFYVSNDQIDTVRKIQEILFPNLTPQSKRYINKRNDVDHLAGHLLNGRDVFVTDDRDFLDKRGQLKQMLNLHVASPRECLMIIEDPDFDSSQSLAP